MLFSGGDGKSYARGQLSAQGWAPRLLMGHHSPSWYAVEAMLKDDNYCPACGSPLEAKEVASRQRPVCRECGKVVYHDPKIAATCVVEREGKVLMIRRALQPGIGHWSLPGGYVDRGEVVEEAAAREVQEETGLVVEVERLVGLYSQRGHPVLVAVFAAHETGGTLAAGVETSDVDFFSLASLPPLAFPRDEEILARWKVQRDGRKETRE